MKNNRLLDLKDYKDTVEMTLNFKGNFENTGIMIEGRVYTGRTIPVYEKAIKLEEIREKRAGLEK